MSRGCWYKPYSLQKLRDRFCQVNTKFFSLSDLHRSATVIHAHASWSAANKIDDPDNLPSHRYENKPKTAQLQRLEILGTSAPRCTTTHTHWTCLKHRDLLLWVVTPIALGLLVLTAAFCIFSKGRPPQNTEGQEQQEDSIGAWKKHQSP